MGDVQLRLRGMGHPAREGSEQGGSAATRACFTLAPAPRARGAPSLLLPCPSSPQRTRVQGGGDVTQTSAAALTPADNSRGFP